MKKKTGIAIICVVSLIGALFGALCIIDHCRMAEDKPVVFSTWGKKYAPKEEQQEEFNYPIKTVYRFVGTVLEETTTYMIVEPASGKMDPYIADKVKVEYGTDHLDYLYGVGRKVVIYYQGQFEDIGNGMKLIKTDDISTEGYRDFELEIRPTDKKVKRQIVERTPPTDSSGRYWIYGDAALYYYGVENVLVDFNGWTMSLEQALEEGRITLNAIVAKCNQDVSEGIIEELSYDDGGSSVYKYPEYTVIKYHTLDGNRDVYIGSTDMDIQIATK